MLGKSPRRPSAQHPHFRSPYGPHSAVLRGAASLTKQGAFDGEKCPNPVPTRSPAPRAHSWEPISHCRQLAPMDVSNSAAAPGMQALEVSLDLGYHSIPLQCHLAWGGRDLQDHRVPILIKHTAIKPGQKQQNGGVPCSC